MMLRWTLALSVYCLAGCAGVSAKTEALAASEAAFRPPPARPAPPFAAPAAPTLAAVRLSAPVVAPDTLPVAAPFAAPATAPAADPASVPQTPADTAPVPAPEASPGAAPDPVAASAPEAPADTVPVPAPEASPATAPDPIPAPVTEAPADTAPVPLSVTAPAALPAAPAAPAPAPKAATPAPAKNVLVTDASFGCIRDLTPVRGFYVGNLLGDVEATVAAANSTGGRDYPPGAIVQLVPGEAMIKHAPGFNSATSDWEFIELYVRPSETKIAARGTEQLLDPSSANCIACSATAETQWEISCKRSGGCTDQVTPPMVKALQNTDPRCARMVLPADQLSALTEFAALRVAAARAGSPSATAQP